MVEFLKNFGRRAIHKAQKVPKVEVSRNNPWYTDDQFEVAEKWMKTSLRHRYDFVLNSIGCYMSAYPTRPLRVLEAGCGDGVQLQGLIQMPGLEIWGVDYNLIRTGRAQEKFQEANIICGDLLHIPFKSDAFDIVLCSQVIEHIPQDDVLLEQLAKILKPEGLLILGTPNEGCLMARLRNHVFERNILRNTDHFHFYREPVVRRKIEAAGFTIQEVMRENWFFPHQRINYYLAGRHWGFRIMACLNKVIPSQTAGYYFRCVRCP
jgi:2-polyprenyl-3-methyl-5-hydroxy-6-metoxy-1,4-benzoquinol methylase